MLLGTMPRAGAADTGTGASQILRTTLDNGLQVVIVRNTLAPVVTTAVNYLVGSNEAPAGFPGMAHAQEHMMFRGGPELSAAQLSYLSAAMGGEFDASTQQTMTLNRRLCGFHLNELQVQLLNGYSLVLDTWPVGADNGTYRTKDGRYVQMIGLFPHLVNPLLAHLQCANTAQTIQLIDWYANPTATTRPAMVIGIERRPKMA